MKIRICEMLKTIQGEGKLQGIPSVIIRLKGCNLHCEWCDTTQMLNSNEVGIYDEKKLLEMLAYYRCSYVIITGGEPAIYSDITQLTRILKSNGYHITVETNGTLYVDFECDLISISPKLSNSIPYKTGNSQLIEEHNERRINITAIQNYIQSHDYQIKFVCRNLDSDFEEVKDILKQIGTYQLENIMIMPLADTKDELERVQQDIVRKCVKNGFRYANRLQLQIWNNDKEE